jgi:hypothetical protein
MTLNNIYPNRELRRSSGGIEADSPEASARLEGDRLREAASALLGALGRTIHELELWQLGNIKDEGTEIAIRIGNAAVEQAAIAGIGTGEPGLPSRFAFTYEPEENPNRAYVLVDGWLDIAIIRRAEGTIIEIYPKDWIDPIDRLTVRDDDIAAAESDASEAAEEA